MTNVALKEIHIANKKCRDANVRFVSLIKEADPRFAYKGKNIKNSRLLINSEENSENNLVKKYKSKLAEKILKEDVDLDIEYAGKFIGDIDRILFNEPFNFFSLIKFTIKSFFLSILHFLLLDKRRFLTTC